MYKLCAQIEEDCYRYALRKIWDLRKPEITVIMLNPSTADKYNDDHTVKKLRTICGAHGYGGFEILNLFAYRATNPKELYDLEVCPIGPKNNDIIEDALKRSKSLLVAWGNHGKLNDRDKQVISMFSATNNIFCLGKNKNGTPKHPGHLSNRERFKFF